MTIQFLHSKEILGQIIESKERAKEKLASGEMMLQEEEDHLKELTGLKKIKRDKLNKVTRNKIMPLAKKETIEEVNTLFDNFDPESATKKEIRTVRKILTQLMHERFPKSTLNRHKKEEVVPKAKATKEVKE